MDTFLGSLVQSCCGEGGTLQTTLACARSDSATLGLPPLTECVLSLSILLRLNLCWGLSEAGPGLHAPPRSKPLRFRHSGSPQRLVDNVSLGLQFPPSGSGCLSPEGDGLQPVSSVLPFALCTGLGVS